jgi:hypothetical protein
VTAIADLLTRETRARLLALGTAEGKGAEYRAQAQAVADLCRLVGADESLVPEWIEVGRRRAASAAGPPFSDGLRP